MKIETKDHLLNFLKSYVDQNTCSQGKGTEVFHYEDYENTKLKEGLPTGGCGDPHYLSRDKLLDLLKRIETDALTEEEVEQWECW